MPRHIHRDDSAPRDAYAQLASHYAQPAGAALRAHKKGVHVVGYTSPAVPWELISAAGFFPVLLQAPRVATPLADIYMEPVFETRIRELFDSVLAHEWNFLKLMVMPRASEHEYKLFLYLEEVARLEKRRGWPRRYLYNVLQSGSARAHLYTMREAHMLAAYLEELSGRAISKSKLAAAIQWGNRKREALRTMDKLRRSKRPRVSGVEALTITGASFFLDAREFVGLAMVALGDFAKRQPLKGPRLLIKGSPTPNTELHQAIERLGAIVTAEDDWWGARSATGTIKTNNDPLAAIVQNANRNAVGPRVFPPKRADQWFQQRVKEPIDAVVFYLPEDDDTLGFDYPRHRKFVHDLGLPHILVRDPRESTLADFITRLKGIDHGA